MFLGTFILPIHESYICLLHLQKVSDFWQYCVCLGSLSLARISQLVDHSFFSIGLIFSSWWKKIQLLLSFHWLYIVLIGIVNWWDNTNINIWKLTYSFQKHQYKLPQINHQEWHSVTLHLGATSFCQDYTWEAQIVPNFWQWLKHR